MSVPHASEKGTIFFQRGLSTAALWIGVLVLIFSGWKTGCVAMLGLFAALAQWEFYHIQETKGFRVFKKWGVLCGLILSIACWYLFLHAPRVNSLGRFELVEQIVFVTLTIGVLLRLVIFKEEIASPILTVALTLFGFFYVPFLFSFVAVAAFRPEVPYAPSFILLYLLAVTKFCDAGAYVVGSLCGRHKMIPRISPGKTWEGFVGGLAASVGISILLRHLEPTAFPGFRFSDAIVVGILLSLASVVGDLAESVVKRDAHIKDSGHFFPGIGGILDLIDSLLFTAPVFYFYIRFLLHL